MSLCITSLFGLCTAATQSGIQPKTIPTYEVRLERPAGVFPFTDVALRFQFMELEADKIRFFSPLSEGKFDTQGRLVLCFPKSNAIIRFSQPNFELSFFGHKSMGGKGETILSPMKMALDARGASLLNSRDKQLLLYEGDFKLARALALETEWVWPGPDKKFLVGASDRLNDFIRVNAENRPEVFYSLPHLPGYQTDGQRVLASIRPDWACLMARIDGSQAYHLDPKGGFIARFSFDYSAVFNAGSEAFPNGVRIEGIAFENQAYYMLFQVPRSAVIGTPRQPIASQEKADPKVSFLLQFDATGAVLGFWETPFFVDGFCMDPKSIAIYYKKTAKLMSLRLN